MHAATTVDAAGARTPLPATCVMRCIINERNEAHSNASTNKKTSPHNCGPKSAFRARNIEASHVRAPVAQRMGRTTNKQRLARSPQIVLLTCGFVRFGVRWQVPYMEANEGLDSKTNAARRPRRGIQALQALFPPWLPRRSLLPSQELRSQALRTQACSQ